MKTQGCSKGGVLCGPLSTNAEARGSSLLWVPEGLFTIVIVAEVQNRSLKRICAGGKLVAISWEKDDRCIMSS